MVQKSPDAFRTISEVAEMLEVQQHVLRFWESKFAQIKPLKRGGGRRYYRPNDVHLIRGIQEYLHNDGYTIKGVQKILKDKGLRAVMERGRLASGELDAAMGQTKIDPLVGKADLPVPAVVKQAMPEQAAPKPKVEAKEPATSMLSDAQRGKLTNILDDLVSLKARLAAARAVHLLDTPDLPEVSGAAERLATPVPVEAEVERDPGPLFSQGSTRH